MHPDYARRSPQDTFSNGADYAMTVDRSPPRFPSVWGVLSDFEGTRSVNCSPLAYSPTKLDHLEPLPFDSLSRASSSSALSESGDSLDCQSPQTTTEDSGTLDLPLLLRPEYSIFVATANQYYQDFGHDAKSRRNSGIGIELPELPVFRSMLLALGDEAASVPISLQLPAGNSLTRRDFEKNFNALIDASHALLLRNAIDLTDLGYHLGQAASVLSRHDKDSAALVSIKNSIGYIKDESERQDLNINFYALEHHRSTSSNYGLSFLEEQHLLYVKLQSYLEATVPFRQLAAEYLDDPPSLRDHRLLQSLGMTLPVA